MFDNLIADARFAFRTFRRAPGFAFAAILCLALGIGANAVIFSVVHGVLLRPLPYAEPERLVSLIELRAQGSGGPVSWLTFFDWRDQARAFEHMTAFTVGGSILRTDDDSERLEATRGTADYFSVHGVPPLLGRTFAPGDDQPGHEPVAVLNEALWRRRFGANPAVLGRTVLLDDMPHTVVGVIPESFDPNMDVWLPLVAPPDARGARYSTVLSVRARLAPGITLDAATEQLKAVTAGIAAAGPEALKERTARVDSLAEAQTRLWSGPLKLLLGAVALVLLIACANVANILLARASGRRQELAVRVALGATRARVIQQLLVESLLLALTGGALGGLFAHWGLAALLAVAPESMPHRAAVSLDGTTFLFLAAISIGSGLAFGLLPALQVSRLDLRGAPVSSGQRLRSTLIVVELAVCLVLLMGAGLLGRGFFQLLGTAPGLDSEQLLTLHIAIPDTRFFNDQGLDANVPSTLLEPILDEVRALPGVSAVGMTSLLPIQRAWNNARYVIEGEPPPEPGSEHRAERRSTSPGFFATLGIPLKQGRDFTTLDAAPGQPATVIINETLARRHFPDGNALGRQLRLGTGAHTIIGVVGDVRQAGLDKTPLAELHVPYGRPWGDDSLVLVARTSVPPETLLPSVREAIRRVDSSLPVFRALTMDQVISQSLGFRRLVLCLLGGFAALALVLSTYGLYGVISLLVSQRTRELGIRMALGARPQDVLRLVLGQGARLTGVGIALGLMGSLALSRLLTSQLHGLTATDPLTFGAVATFFSLIALLACWFPARRATRVDPLVALRNP
ncbi:ABC transporter permease [Myxococcus qinghaiensis]|uniref:ABC transporter permease n=1 Tax=Myxococcus qinghaiensis TaxID=2906758 RepID=UPI0020A7EBFE|nr:ABC transporter permease [Myxococcus qinghaiensis]MCP3161977.1 ABC transporter permease [Myxococcus qinghaiensis]